jgi:hypothetical protein
MKFGTDCPKCNGMGVKWARLMSEREYMRSTYGEQGAAIRDWNSPTLTAGEQKDNQHCGVAVHDVVSKRRYDAATACHPNVHAEPVHTTDAYTGSETEATKEQQWLIV